MHACGYMCVIAHLPCGNLKNSACKRTVNHSFSRPTCASENMRHMRDCDTQEMPVMNLWLFAKLHNVVYEYSS